METANTKGEDFIKLEEKLKMTEEITMAIYNIIKKSIDNIPSLDFNQNQTLHDFLDVVESLETKRYEQLVNRHSISVEMENEENMEMPSQSTEQEKLEISQVDKATVHAAAPAVPAVATQIDSVDAHAVYPVTRPAPIVEEEDYEGLTLFGDPQDRMEN